MSHRKYPNALLALSDQNSESYKYLVSYQSNGSRGSSCQPIECTHLRPRRRFELFRNGFSNTFIAQCLLCHCQLVKLASQKQDNHTSMSATLKCELVYWTGSIGGGVANCRQHIAPVQHITYGPFMPCSSRSLMILPRSVSSLFGSCAGDLRIFSAACLDVPISIPAEQCDQLNQEIAIDNQS